MDSGDELSVNDSYVAGLLDEIKALRKQIEEDLDIFEDVDAKIEFVKSKVLSTERELEMWKMFHEEQRTKDLYRMNELQNTIVQQEKETKSVANTIRQLCNIQSCGSSAYQEDKGQSLQDIVIMVTQLLSSSVIANMIADEKCNQNTRRSSSEKAPSQDKRMEELLLELSISNQQMEKMTQKLDQERLKVVSITADFNEVQRQYTALQDCTFMLKQSLHEKDEAYLTNSRNWNSKIELIQSDLENLLASRQRAETTMLEYRTWADQEISANKLQLQQKGQELEGSIAESSRLLAQIHTLTNDNLQLQAHLQTLQIQLDASLDTTEVSERALNDLRADHEHTKAMLSGEAAEQAAAVAERESQLTESREKLEGLRGKHKELVAKHKALKAEQESSQQQIEVLKQEKTVLTSEHESTVASLRGELTEAMTSVSAAQRQLEEARDEWSKTEVSLRSQVESLEREMSALSSKESSLESEISRLKKEVEERESSLTEKESMLGKREEEVRDVRSTNVGLEEQLSAIRRELEVATEAKEASERALNDLRADHEHTKAMLSGEAAEQAAAVAERESQLTESREKLEGLRGKHKELVAKHKALKAEQESSQQQIEVLKQEKTVLTSEHESTVSNVLERLKTSEDILNAEKDNSLNLSNRVALLSDDNDSLHRNVDTFLEKFAVTEQALSSTKQAFCLEEERVKELESEVMSLRSSLIGKEERLAQVSSKEAEQEKFYSNKSVDLEAKLTLQSNEIDRLYEELSRAEESLRGAHNENKQLQNELDRVLRNTEVSESKDAETSKLQQDIDAYKMKFSDLVRKHKDLRNELSELKSTNTKLLQQSNDKESSLQDVRNNLQEVSEKLALEMNETSRLHSELSTLKPLLEEREQKLLVARQDNVVLRDEFLEQENRIRQDKERALNAKNSEILELDRKCNEVQDAVTRGDELRNLQLAEIETLKIEKMSLQYQLEESARHLKESRVSLERTNGSLCSENAAQESAADEREELLRESHDESSKLSRQLQGSTKAVASYQQEVSLLKEELQKLRDVYSVRMQEVEKEAQNDLVKLRKDFEADRLRLQQEKEKYSSQCTEQIQKLNELTIIMEKKAQLILNLENTIAELRNQLQKDHQERQQLELLHNQSQKEFQKVFEDYQRLKDQMQISQISPTIHKIANLPSIAEEESNCGTENNNHVDSPDKKKKVMHIVPSTTEVVRPTSALSQELMNGSATFEDLEIAPRNRERNRTMSLVNLLPQKEKMQESSSVMGIAFDNEDLPKAVAATGVSNGRSIRSFTIDTANAQILSRNNDIHSTALVDPSTPLSEHSGFADDISHISNSSYFVDANSHPNSLLNLSDTSFLAGLDQAEQDKMLMELACAKVHFATASYELELERLAKRKRSAKLRQEQKELDRRLQQHRQPSNLGTTTISPKGPSRDNNGNHNSDLDDNHNHHHHHTNNNNSNNNNANRIPSSPYNNKKMKRPSDSVFFAQASPTALKASSSSSASSSSFASASRVRSPSMQDTFQNLFSAASDMFTNFGTPHPTVPSPQGSKIASPARTKSTSSSPARVSSSR